MTKNNNDNENDDIFNNKEYRKVIRQRITLGLVGFIALAIIVTLFLGLHNIDADERGVVFHKDGSLSVLQPGKFQWVTPIFNTVTVYNVQDVAYTKSAVGISLDLQETTTEVTVRYHPEYDAIQTIHQTVGLSYEDRIVAPAVQGCVKNAVSFFNVEELTGAIRAKVMQDISSCIEQDLVKGHLVTTKITVTDFDFSKEFNAAIEAKAIAQQKAQEEKNRLEQVRYQANQTILQATAQAESARLLAQTIKENQGSAYLFLEYLKKWDGHLPGVLTDGGNSTIMISPPKTN